MARAVFLGGAWRLISKPPAYVPPLPTGGALAPSVSLAPSTTLTTKG